MPTEEYPQGKAAKRYNALMALREPFLARARKVAALTIPTLFQPEGTKGQDITDPNQSMGARGTNNLSSKLLLALFPPNMSFYRYQLDTKSMAQLEATADEARRQDPNLTPDDDPQFQMEKGLNAREELVRGEFEAAGARSALYPVFRHLVIAGNVLLHFPNKGVARYFSLNSYVVKRDYSGNVLEVYVKEKVAFRSLPLATQAEVAAACKKAFDPLDDLEVYTGIEYCNELGETPKWKVWQEVASITVENSIGSYPKDDCHYRALRWSRIDGEDYGRGYAEDYLGDLQALDKLSYALVAGTYVAAKTVGMVKPGSNTDADDLEQAQTGDIIEGDAADVTFVQTGKAQDYAVANSRIESLKSDLGFAFLLNSTVPRNADRVTATEVTFVAQELEDSLGGIYSLFSDELQKPLVLRIERRLETNKSLKPLPEGSVKPIIITGLDALGRSHEVSRLTESVKALTDMVGPQAVQMILKVDSIATAILRGNGLNPTQYVKTTQEIKQQAAQAAQQSMAQNVAPEVVKQAGQMMQNAQAVPTQGA